MLSIIRINSDLFIMSDSHIKDVSDGYMRTGTDPNKFAKLTKLKLRKLYYLNIIKNMFTDELYIFGQLQQLHDKMTDDVGNGELKSNFEQILPIILKMPSYHLFYDSPGNEYEYSIASIEPVSDFIKNMCFEQLSEYNKNYYMTNIAELIKQQKKQNLKNLIQSIGKAASIESAQQKIQLREYLKEFEIANIDNTKIFKFDILADLAINWAPMRIKSISSIFNDQAFLSKNQDKFIISSAHGGELNTPPIPLRENEYVIMNCNPWKSTILSLKLGMNLLLNKSGNQLVDSLDNFRDFINNYLRLNTYKYNRDDWDHGEEFDYKLEKFKSLEDTVYKNNFCVFSNKCPDISLSYYNESKDSSANSQLMSEIPMSLIQVPVKYKSSSFGELINKIESTIEEEDNKQIFSSMENYTKLSTKNPNIDDIESMLTPSSFEQITLFSKIDTHNSESDIKIRQSANRLKYITKYLDESDEITTYAANIDPNKKIDTTLKSVIENLRIQFPNGFLLLSFNCRSPGLTKEEFDAQEQIKANMTPEEIEAQSQAKDAIRAKIDEDYNKIIDQEKRRRAMRSSNLNMGYV